MQKQSPFISARITLTLWYCGILILILSSFSVALYVTQTRNFARVVLQRDYGSHPPKILTRPELRELALQVRALRRGFVGDLVLLDVIVLIIGGGLSYFLAGKTLQPIQRSFTQQRSFLSDVSHELRTPLASIQAATEVALRTKAKTKEEYKKVIEQTYSETKRLTKMANDLLFLSRIDSDAFSIQFHEANLVEIMNSALEQIHPLAEKKQIHIQKDMPTSIFLRVDRDKIKQLFIIFLDNAVKFTSNGGIITITMKSGNHPIVIITDTGIGISQETLPHIFNRFYQGDTSRNEEGAGLGLSIAKSITDMHHAEITATSKIGKGTTFTIQF